MRPSLILQPFHNSSAEIIKSFSNGKPISPDQLHLLELHQKELSNTTFDPILDYYLALHKKHPQKYQGTFLLHHEAINFEDIQKLKERIRTVLKEKNQPVSIPVSVNQLRQFADLNSRELIFWYGNQYLTGAPLVPGGIPPVIYFQWGNLFGIVKYLVLAGEKALKANLLMFFEDMLERNLDQCVMDYQKKLRTELIQQNEILYQHNLEPEKYQHFLIKQAHPYPHI
jgi:hypothetical protein